MTHLTRTLLLLPALLLFACGTPAATPSPAPGAATPGSGDHDPATYTGDPAFTRLQAPVSPDRWLTEDQNMLDEINGARARAQTCTEKDGSVRTYPATHPVTPEGHLQRAATWHAEDMATRGYMAHLALAPAPHGTHPYDRIFNAGYRPVGGLTLAENLAAFGPSSNDPASIHAVVLAWLGSHDGHCQALMNPAYIDVGIWQRDGYWATEYAAPL